MAVRHRPLSALERAAAWITLKDPDQLAAGPMHERIAAVHDLILWALVVLLQFFLWFGAVATYTHSVVAAAVAALLVAALIGAIDVKLASGDTSPRGVLRRGPLPKGYAAFILSRLTISVLLSNVTATALDEVVFRQEALEIQRHETQARNADVIVEYDQKRAALRTRIVGPLEDEITSLTGQRAQTIADQVAASRKIEEAHAAGANADLDAERENAGVDRPGGHGPLAIDAEKRRELASEQAQFLAGRQTDLAQTVDALTRQIAATTAQLARAQPRYVDELRRLNAEQKTRLAQETAGPLTVMLGLWKLRADPERGGIVWFVTISLWAAVMALELAYFLARTVFRGASFHDLAINMDLQRRAAQLAHELEDELRRRRRPPLRVRDNEPDDGPRDGPIH